MPETPAITTTTAPTKKHEGMEKKIAHLNMIQGVINRMATNSFQVKGWSVVIVSALFALASREARPTLVYIAFLPAMVFWPLDGYFLWQERLFRRISQWTLRRMGRTVRPGSARSSQRRCLCSTQ
jgi:hypothetical protein